MSANNNTLSAFQQVFRSLATSHQQPPQPAQSVAGEIVETMSESQPNAPEMDIEMRPADSDDDMPALRDVSESDESGSEFLASDSEMDADELEVQLQTIHDSQDADPAVVAAAGVSGTPAGVRRTRGSSDGDQDRDRRHPSQRTTLDESTANTPLSVPLPSDNHSPPPPTSPQQQPNPPTDPHFPRAQNLMRLLGFRIDFPSGQIHPLPQNGQAGVFGGTAFPLNFAGDVEDLFARLGGIAGGPAEPEDPERAKRLVDGLEQVPVGLVRRLERVGNVGGTDDNGTGGDSGCAICWDRLLDGDGTQFVDGSKDTTSDAPENVSDSPEGDPPVPVLDAQHPKIVALPCAHVFHASCLIPWFSRPRQTTCPTCRFNIDPENLTYRRRRRPAPPSTLTTPATAGTELNATIPEVHTTGVTPPAADAVPQPQGPTLTANGGANNNLGATLLQEFFHALRANGAVPQPPTFGPAPIPGQTLQNPAGHAHPQNISVNINGNPVNVDREGGIVFDLLNMIVPLQGTNEGPVPQPTANPPVPPTLPVQVPIPDETPTNAAASVAEAPVNTSDDDIPGLEPIDVPLPSEPPITTENNNQRAQAQAQAALDASRTFRGHQATGPQVDNGHNHGLHGLNPGDFVTVGFDMFFGTGPVPFDMNGGMAGQDDEMMQDAGMTAFFGTMPMPMGGGGQPQPNSAQDGANLGGMPFATGVTMEHLLSNLTTRLGVQFPPGQHRNAHSHVHPHPHAPQGGAHGTTPHIDAHGPFMFPFQAPQPAPSQQPAQAQQPSDGQVTPQQPHVHAHGGWGGFNLPPVRFGGPPASAANGEQANNADGAPGVQLPHFAQFLSGAGLPGDMGAVFAERSRAQAHAQARRPRERKKWTLPSAPGPTLRQRVERKEREAGLRCHDMSCGVGPSDDDPNLDVSEKQLRIRRVDDGNVCEHCLHASCLVTSQRVMLSGLSESVVGECVEVTCPVCRCDGMILKAEWEAGAAC